jgi:hypothetical protein
MTATRILHVDAAGSALFGLLLLADGAVLAPHFGLSSTAPLAAVGVFLLAFAALLVAVARRRPIERPLLLGLAAGDLLWVVACAAVLLYAWSDMTALGRVIVVVNALWGEAMGWLKYRAAARELVLAHA